MQPASRRTFAPPGGIFPPPLQEGDIFGKGPQAKIAWNYILITRSYIFIPYKTMLNPIGVVSVIFRLLQNNFFNHQIPFQNIMRRYLPKTGLCDRMS